MYIQVINPSLKYLNLLLIKLFSKFVKFNAYLRDLKSKIKVFHDKNDLAFVNFKKDVLQEIRP